MVEILIQGGDTETATREMRAAIKEIFDIDPLVSTRGDGQQPGARLLAEITMAPHEQEFAVYEALGDRRSRAVRFGDIARIRRNKGEVDAALALQNERLSVNRELGDLDGIAAAQFDIGQILLSRAMSQEDAAGFQEAFDALTESYAIFDRIGRLDGLCGVGMILAQLLAMAGQRDEARTMVERARDGYRKLGWDAQIAESEELLRMIAE